MKRFVLTLTAAVSMMILNGCVSVPDATHLKLTLDQAAVENEAELAAAYFAERDAAICEAAGDAI